MPVHVIASNEQRALLGLGATGCSVARWWRDQGVPFIALDTRAEIAQSATVKEAIGADTPMHAGDIDPGLLSGITELVVSPGIELEHPLVQLAREAGARVTGDIDLFVRQAQAPVIGITGSNGKSTVTAWLASLLNSCGVRASAGGNLGPPALDLLRDPADCYVLELSSFQLERSDALNLAIATVLNVSPDHLDRHGTLPKYHQAKHRIFRGAGKIVANRGDPLTVPLADASVERVLWRLGEPDLNEFGVRAIDGQPTVCRGHEALLPVSSLPLPGTHNLGNALTVLALGSALGVPLQQLVSGLGNFRGLAHRCEWVAERDGVTWINDSKATNVDATRAALSGLGESNNIVLIAGGVGKAQDFTPLAPEASTRCRRVLTMGEDARAIELALGAHVPVQRVEDLAHAVATASQCAQAGDIVLLSPACASFDMYADFAARGDAFRDLVQSTEATVP